MTDLASIAKREIVAGPVSVQSIMELQDLCCKPYEQHPKGCPNYGKKPGCPPIAFFPHIFKPEAHIVAIEFDFASYLSMMKSRHPGWTDRQLRNPLYWQGHVRLALRQLVKKTHIEGYRPLYVPEAMGVHVTATCEQAGIKLEWPPMNRIYTVALFVQPQSWVETPKQVIDQMRLDV